MKASLINKKLFNAVGLSLILLAVYSAATANVETTTEDQSKNASSLTETQLAGASVMAFGGENVLFVGDSKNAMVYAIETEAVALKEPVPFNLFDFDKLLAKKLDTTTRDLLISDMKIHPVSQEAYLAVKRDHHPETPAQIVIVNQSGDIRFLDIKTSKISKVAIKNPASDEVNFWRDIPANSLSITDIDYYDNHIYVAGLSNGEFASTLRKIAYPFEGEQAVVASIEMYHAVHTQYETRAPIRTMTIAELDGKPTLIATYTCTPLVTIALSDIEDGRALKGKTIAELGYGNAPVDMITYVSKERDGSMDAKLLVTHKQRSGSLMSLKDVGKAAYSDDEGLAGQTSMGLLTSGDFTVTPPPTSTILQLDNQNIAMVASLKRDIETGGLNMVSELKGAFFRLSDFVAEYNFPDYKYTEDQESRRQFHDMVKPMEGYPELASTKTGK